MDIQPLLAYNTWLSLPVDTRVKLKTLFNIPRTGEVIVRTGEMTAQGNIGSVTTQDGHSAKDLYAITVEKMQDVTGSTVGDFYALFNLVVEHIDDIIDNRWRDDISANEITIADGKDNGDGTTTVRVVKEVINGKVAKKRGRPAKQDGKATK